MERTTVLIPAELRRRLADEARRRRVPQSELIRAALERYLASSRPDRPRLEGVADAPGVDARGAKSSVREHWEQKAALE